jgi:hypothetical protein
VPKYRACLLAIACLLILVVPAACQQDASSSPSTTAATTQSISARVVEALGQVTAFTLETDLAYSGGPPSATAASGDEWISTRSFDIPGGKMQLVMTASDGHFEYDTSRYLTGGWLYYYDYNTGMVSTNVPPWFRRQLGSPDQQALFSSQDQLGLYAELLTTAAQTSLIGSESIGGTDCYMLEVSPSFQAMLDWLRAQGEGSGPAIAFRMDGLQFERPDTYQRGTLKLWVNKSTYLPVKAELSAFYQGFMGPPMIPASPHPYTPTDNPYQESFTAAASFSGFGSPLNITLPADAVSAPVHS